MQYLRSYLKMMKLQCNWAVFISCYLPFQQIGGRVPTLEHQKILEKTDEFAGLGYDVLSIYIYIDILASWTSPYPSKPGFTKGS